MAWKVEFSDVAAGSLSCLDKEAMRRIRTYLETRLATDENPRRFGKALQGNLSGYWRYRVGDYRIICDIQDESVRVLVIDLGHRSRIYGGH